MNIVISGCTCSGKTTLANKLSKTIMSQDSYYKDLKDIPKHKEKYLMDSINAFHINEYLEDSINLINNDSIYIPNYDISTNKRISKDLKLFKSSLNVFEGLHTINILKDINTLKIFLNTSLDECLKRRIKRDTLLYRIDEKVIIDYFNETIIPMYKLYIENQKDSADIIIKEGDDPICVLKKYIKY